MYLPAFRSSNVLIAALSIVCLLIYAVLRISDWEPHQYHIPLFLALIMGGTPLLLEQLRNLFRFKFASDLLAGISIVVGTILEEYAAAVLVVLMLSGGEALEQYAVGQASSVLKALAKRLPQIAHKRQNGNLLDTKVEDVQPGDEITVFPHEICPVDGEVISGHGVMDEAYLTGEPFTISKGPGSEVLSGAINGDTALTIRATKRAQESRYAQIMAVMQETAHKRVPLRRIGDILGSWYTPFAVSVAIAAWVLSNDAHRFLAVLVVATPCPLIIAIPVAIIATISVAAKRSIIIRDPAILETINSCETIIFDKTGTLTLGLPSVSHEIYYNGYDRAKVLPLVLALESYSKHPLAIAFQRSFREQPASTSLVERVSEPPGKGLEGVVGQSSLLITSRKNLVRQGQSQLVESLPEASGLECIVVIDGKRAALFQFRDEPRPDSLPFIEHLRPRHRFERILLVSGDRESEVRYLAEQVGITEVHAGKSPEEKVQIVREESKLRKTLFVGDGINDAPALLAAHVGVALGQAHDITIEAAGAVILEPALSKVDELFHLSSRMKRIALQSAIGGMALSIIGMFFAAGGALTPVAGALAQEAIDLIAVLNALRAVRLPPVLTDMDRKV